MSRRSIPNNIISFYGDPQGTVTRHYALDYINVYKIGEFLKRTALNSTYMYNDQSEYIVSLRAYPINVLLWFYDNITTPSPVPIAIGPFSTADVNANGYDFGNIGSTGLRNLPNQKNIVKLTTITINETFNNFMDYDNTVLELYLPFFGFVQLDNAKYMGKKFSVYASIDFANGGLLYSLCYGDASVNDTIGDLIESFSCHIGIDISLTRTNANDIMRNTYFNSFKLLGLAVGGAVSSGVTGKTNYGQLINGAIGGTETFMRGLQKHISHGSVGSGRNALISPTSIILIQNKANPVTVNSTWEHMNGYPLQDSYILSSLKGYTEIGEIHFNPMGEPITNDEMNEIISLLQSGVVL